MSNEGKKWKMRYADKIDNMFNDSDEYVDLNDSNGMTDEQFNKWFDAYKARIQQKEYERTKDMSKDELEIDEFKKYFGLK